MNLCTQPSIYLGLIAIEEGINAGIDPATSRMLSKRATLWANSPD